MLKIATSFSGGFGSIEFAMKYEDIPHEVVFACEWLDPQRKSYLHNHGEPTSNFYKDIRDLDGTKYKGEIDLYHLSPPCQSYSLAGQREGAEDERGGLMFEAVKSIDEVQPKMFTIENVKGLLSSNDGEDWKNILRDVKSLKGYTVQYGVMNAKDQGTPQNRERVFIVGFRGRCMPMPFPKRIKLDKCLADVLEEIVDEKYYLSDQRINTLAKSNRSVKHGDKKTEYAPTVMASYAKIPTDGFYIKSATKDGYETAQEGDSINLTFPNSKTRRGRVGKSVAQTLDTACNMGVIDTRRKKEYNGIKKDEDAQRTLKKANAFEVLQILWREAREKALSKWSIGEFTSFQQEEILQSRLHGKEFCKSWRTSDELRNSTSHSTEHEETFYKTEMLREMWEAWEDGYSSYRREFPKQLIRELDDIVQKLSHEATSSKTDMQNRGMRNESKRTQLLQQALYKIQKIWKSYDNKVPEQRIRRLSPRECSRVQGDFRDMFKQGEASDTKLYEFIGNAMDISTTRNLLKAMFAYKVEFGEPLEPSFVRKEVVKSTLF